MGKNNNLVYTRRGRRKRNSARCPYPKVVAIHSYGVHIVLSPFLQHSSLRRFSRKVKTIIHAQEGDDSKTICAGGILHPEIYARKRRRKREQMMEILFPEEQQPTLHRKKQGEECVCPSTPLTSIPQTPSRRRRG